MAEVTATDLVDRPSLAKMMGHRITEVGRDPGRACLKG